MTETVHVQATDVKRGNILPLLVVGDRLVVGVFHVGNSVWVFHVPPGHDEDSPAMQYVRYPQNAEVELRAGSYEF